MISEEQNKIYEGLKSIGETLANFYLDGVNMSKPDCTLLSRANLIAHMAREIDGGLRDVFAPSKIAKQNEILFPNKEDKNGHFASILAVMGTTDLGNTFAKKWYAVASQFHRIAHRENIHKASADPTVILNLWSKYEGILSAVIGSFLSITNRLDVLLSQDMPEEKALPALKNILQNPKHAQYFFSKLDKQFWISHLKTEGYFNPEYAPVKKEGYDEPEYWFPVLYLKNVAHCAKRKRATILKEIIDNIVSSYVSDKIDLNSFTVDTIAEVISVAELIKFDENARLFFEKYSLRSGYSWVFVHSTLIDKVAPNILGQQDKESMLQLLNYFFGYITIEEPGISFFEEEEPEPYVRQRPFVEKTFVDEFLKRHGKSIVSLVGDGAVRIAVQKIIELDKIPTLSISSFSIPSIETTDQSYYGNDWGDLLVFFIRDYASELTKESLEILVDEMILSKVSVLQRLAIHLIRSRYSEMEWKWWAFIETTNYDDEIYIHEPFVLLQQYSHQFNDIQFEKAIQWIEAINMAEGWKGEQVSPATAYHIRRWLMSLSPGSAANRELLDKKLQQYEAINAVEIDHPEFNSYGTMHYGFDYPIELREFQQLSLKDQVNFVIGFKSEHEHESTEEGLAEIIRISVVANPEKYLYELSQFLPFHSLFLNDMITGFKDALVKDTLTEYIPVIDFIESKLNDPSFENETEKKYRYRSWLGSSVSEFISVLISKDKIFDISDEECTRLIDLIISMILKKEFNDREDIQKGYASYILNSTIGRLYSVLLKITRFRAEKFLKDEKEKIKWPEVVQRLFTEKLNSIENSDKAYSIILGMELPLIRYLDKLWVDAHISEIFDDTNEKNLSYRIFGLFSGNYSISRETYNFLKQNDLFSKALSIFGDDGAVDTIIEYALMEWKFWGVDPDGDSILSKVFQCKKVGFLKRLIDVVWHRKVYFSPEDAIYLWRRLILSFSEMPEQNPPYSLLSWLFEFTSELTTDLYDLVLDLITKMSETRHAFEILKHIYKIGDTNLELGGKLVSLLYEKKLVSVAFESELKAFTTKVYDAGFKDIANGVCIKVADTGSLALRELFNKWNN